ncbi:prepilin peptidase [Ureibacillus sp. FSL K6-8385]|uniref:Prepilin peptidase n=1 Tax=Ureibacillus terrenus TaxID=118246 RepID=A0A540V6S6_9BACL|nr:A24 family peptidase [Ureibacillus terrenus]MED3660518.1 prepilin peptidase [Ureibacillus terrenus]MED3762671.1 prepilin peptidase [Ureibacillus terrenus]TQE92452.1 prepilin peptidase [Ureibacillus terrenus]
MEIVYSIFFFLFGIVLGSFYNVVGLRVPKKESIIYPPSHCPHCQRRLTAIDLIPVFSYILLRGKCRTCGAGISPVYVVSELATGFMFVFGYLRLGWSFELAVALLFISLLVIIVVSDFQYMIIPDKVLLFFLPLIILGRFLSPLEPWWDAFLGAAIGFAILLGIAVVSKGGMGGGDIKLFLLIGLVLGTVKTVLTLFLSSIIGLFAGIMVLKMRKQGMKNPVPFGPSIAVAAIIVYFYGDSIIRWYWNLF